MSLILAISILLLLPQIILGGVIENHKRWYGVRPLNKGKSMGQFGPWPLVCDSQSVQYCFADARSQKNLENTVNEAIARWAHATIHTSMQIIPDNEDSLLCSGPDIRPDALVISDSTKDNDKPGTTVLIVQPTARPPATSTEPTNVVVIASISAT
jgi:hypothetical protein